ncbi:hypothetical protein M408DRAFT_23223 [Serendipita vermifera MAFF 305830]|uniref:Non-structural maintenance of chromosomes element 1 homolog n=1 Tax=Serendipita vermifera MAFF 305830 TaxID=933852 RepID=A0A0C2XIW2_SERVB|nr:hypothetical protein M408DRAFT_23223 [Serendipita vermifera MAFF 305830]
MVVKQKDVHKLFKQAIISRRFVSEDLAAVLWKKCEDACISLNADIEAQFSREEIGTYINEINDTITPLSIEFKSRIDEVSGKRVWALVNTVDGEIAQLATEYTATEITYFKQLIDLIILAPADAFSVSSLAAIREVTNMKANMTKAQADAALQNFVANGWLYKSERGRYALSTRSLIELELYLRRTFEADVPECTHCTELCTLGYACNNDEIDVLADEDEDSGACKIYIHRHCYISLRRAATAANPLKCPACGSDWTTAPEEQGRANAKGKNKEKTGVKEIGEWSVPEGWV